MRLYIEKHKQNSPRIKQFAWFPTWAWNDDDLILIWLESFYREGYRTINSYKRIVINDKRNN